MQPPPSFAPDAASPADEAWDEDKARWLVGKYALVGVAWVGPEGERSEQYHGRITSAEQGVGISVACEGVWKGETFVIPPATDFLAPAQPGEYKLRSTGETVKNPDVLTTWRIDLSKRDPN